LIPATTKVATHPHWVDGWIAEQGADGDEVLRLDQRHLTSALADADPRGAGIVVADEARPGLCNCVCHDIDLAALGRGQADPQDTAVAREPAHQSREQCLGLFGHGASGGALGVCHPASAARASTGTAGVCCALPAPLLYCASHPRRNRVL
jgi:hypothetical protein